MNRYEPPTIRVEFEHKVRKTYVFVQAEAWHDHEGIYKVGIANVWLDGAEVFDLLTDADIADIESAIEPAIISEASDNRAMGDIPGPFPTL